MTTTLVIRKEGKWLRGSFVIIFCIFVFVFANDSGLLSRLFSFKIFKLFGKIQFEFFIFHQAVIICSKDFLSRIFSDWKIMNLIIFVTIIICSIFYKNFLEHRVSLFTKNFVEKIASAID